MNLAGGTEMTQRSVKPVVAPKPTNNNKNNSKTPVTPNYPTPVDLDKLSDYVSQNKAGNERQAFQSQYEVTVILFNISYIVNQT